MTANIPTTTATAPHFDPPALSSVAIQSAQQAAAPFSQLLQQAQTPPPPPAPPPAPAPPPPRSSSPRHSPNPNSADIDHNQAAAGSKTDAGSSANNSDPASADAAGVSQSDASSQDGSTADTKAQSDPKSPGAATASQSKGTTQKGGRGKTSGKTTGTAEGSHDVAAADAKATETTVAAGATAATSDKTAKQSKGDGHDGDTTKKTEITADSAATPSAVAAQAPAALVAELPAATAPATDDGKAKATADATTATSGQQGIKAGRVAAAATNLLDLAKPAQAKSKPQPAGGPSDIQPSVNSKGVQAKSQANSAAALAPSASATGKLPQEDLPATQAAHSASDAEASAAIQSVATIAVNQAQPVTTITVDPSTSGQAKPDANVTNAPPVAPPSTTVETPPANGPQAGSPAFLIPSHAANAEGSGAPGLSTLDRARFVQRVSRAFQSASDQGGQIRLRLSPPELGSLQMQITLKQGALTAQIQTDNSSAQQVLLDSLPELRERLAQQDIHIERFDVDVAGQSSGGLPQSPQGNQDFDQANRRFSAPRNAPAVSAVEGIEPTRAASLLNSVALNVVV